MHRFGMRLLVLLLTLTVVGCGVGEAPDIATSEDETTGSGNVETVTITLAYNRFLQESFSEAPPPIETIRDAVSARYPNIDIQLNIVPDSISGHRDALTVWMTTEDSTVDIYGMDSPWVLEFGEAGWAVPLNDRLPHLEENFIEAGLDIYSYDGQRLGVPFWGSVGGLFYRDDLLNEYGLEPPQTYDEMVTAIETITTEQPELSGFVWAGAREESLVQVWVEFFRGFGGQYFDAEGNCAINSEAGGAAVSFMRNLIVAGYSPPETTAWSVEEARTRFVEGEALFLRSNHDIVTWLDDPERSDIGGMWDVIPNPAQPDGGHAGATGGFAFAINPFTDNLEESLQVLEVIASEDVQKGFAMAWGPVQYYDGLYDDPEVQEANPNVDKVERLLPSAATRPQSTDYAQVSDILQQEIHSALTEIKPVEEALNDACRRIDAIK